MKRIVILALVFLPLLSAGQRLSEEQSRQRIEQLRHLLQHYKPHYPSEFEFYADCGFAVFTDSTDWQGIVALDGTELLPARYMVYRQTIDGNPSPFFLVMSKEKVGLIDKEMRWVLPMEYDNDFDCMEGCYAPYIHKWFWNGKACLRKEGKYGIVDTAGRIVVPFTSDEQVLPYDDDEWLEDDTSGNPIPSISGPYEHIFLLSEDLFFFYTGNPGDRSDQIFGYVDLYGNTTATPAQLATMEKWKSGVIEYDVEPIAVTDVVLFEEAENRYATVFTCLSDTHRVGYLLVPKEDSASLALFCSCVSEDLWDRPVGISLKRYNATLSDVQQAEALLPEVMKEGVFPKLGRWRHYIGNPDNYRKYERTYGFYYNEQGERCVYIVMSLGALRNRHRIGFSRMWDACDTVVFINLNLDTRQVIRAYASSCQSY